MMEIIYQEKYWSETMDEAKERLTETEPKLKESISSHSFFLAQENDDLEAFLALALSCNQLAAHEDAEIEVVIFPEEATARIFLGAPCFVFQVRQLALLQKINFTASELLFDVTENRTSQITVSFDFSQENDKLYQQFQKRFFQK
jgi:hypothetical protein